MQSISLSEISAEISGKIFGNGQSVIKNIIFDSRSISSDSQTLFFALISKRNNGHNYILELYSKGICNFVVSEMRSEFANLKEANFILTENTLKALQTLGKLYRSKFTGNVTAITGSNGKTVVKEWVYQLLHETENIVRSPKSYNSQIGVAISLTLLENKYQTALIEAGISQKGEMKILENIIKPEIGIFTNIGNAHQENFSDIEQKLSEKLKLFKNSELIIYNSENKLVAEKIEKKFSEKKLFSWGTKPECKIFVTETQKTDNKTLIKINFQKKEYQIIIPFTDKASAQNALSVFTYLAATKKLNQNIINKFSQLNPVEMRLELKQGINNCTLINDYYNSDISSLKIAVNFLNTQNQHKKKTIILSDILQSGTENSELYGEISQIISPKYIGKIIGIGKNLVENKEFFKNISERYFYGSTDEYIEKIRLSDFSEETVLIKGSRKFELEKISELLILKKHRTVMEININAMIHNLNYYKSLIKKDTKIMVMVKAFSYGSGTFETANLLQEQNVDYLGVAFADEGIKLRKAGISVPIIVMNPEPDAFLNMIDYKLEPEIFGINILKKYIAATEKYVSETVCVHIKIDTGMKRLGFCEDQIQEMLDIIKTGKKIRVKSIFSHLAGTDENVHDNFTLEQIKKFEKISKIITDELKYPVIKHILNSSGIERFPQYQFDMVRLGIGLYGFSPNNSEKLQNVSTLKTEISLIKNVNSEETIGYGRKYKTEKPIKIAIIPIGYADGFSRALSNGVGKVLINGKLCNVVGNVSMDMLMADLSGVEAKENDEVIIFGDRYTAAEQAKLLNTIPYEIITGISERVKRVYYRE